MPPLDARREDIPLLARAMMLQSAAKSPQAMAPFIDRTGARPEPRLDPDFVAYLLGLEYPGNLRDLVIVLRAAMAGSRDGVLRVTREMNALRASVPPPAAPTEADVRAAMVKHDGNVTRAAQSMGITRFALLRLLKKYGLRGAA